MYTLQIPIITSPEEPEALHSGPADNKSRSFECDATFPLEGKAAEHNIRRLNQLFFNNRGTGIQKFNELLESIPSTQQRQGPLFWFCAERQFYSTDMVPLLQPTIVNPPIPTYPRLPKFQDNIWCPSSFEEARQVISGLELFTTRTIVIIPVYNLDVFQSVPTGILLTPLDGTDSVWLDYRNMAIDIFKVPLLFTNDATYFVVWSVADMVALKSTFGVSMRNVLILRHLLLPFDVTEETDFDLHSMAVLHFGKHRVNSWAHKRKKDPSLKDRNTFLAINSREWLFKLATLYITTYDSNYLVMAISRSGSSKMQQPQLAAEVRRMNDEQDWKLAAPAAANKWALIEGVRTGWKLEQLLPPQAFNMLEFLTFNGTTEFERSWPTFANHYLSHLTLNQRAELQNVVLTSSLETTLKNIACRNEAKILEAIRIGAVAQGNNSELTPGFGTTKEELQRKKEYYRLKDKIEDCDEHHEEFKYFRYRAILKSTKDPSEIYYALLLWCLPSEFMPEKKHVDRNGGCVLFGSFRGCCKRHVLPDRIYVPYDEIIMIEDLNMIPV